VRRERYCFWGVKSPFNTQIEINRLGECINGSRWPNFVARSFSSIYEPVRAMGGGAYFFTRDGLSAIPGTRALRPFAGSRPLKSSDCERLG